MNNHFTGLVAAPFTPLDKEGNLRLTLVPKLAQSLRTNGVKGAFICGSTGEGVSLSAQEKKLVMEAWSQEQDEKLKVISLLPSNSIEETRGLMQYAKELGLFGVAILPPFYFQVSDTDILTEYCEEIALAVPDMPVYYYHIPSLTGVRLSMCGFLEKISGRVRNFAGIKFTDFDLEDFRKCICYNDGSFDILWGVDECLLAAMAMGAKAGVGSTYNYMAPLYNEMMKCFEEGNLDQARILQDKSIEIIGILKKYGGIGAGKSFMKSIGLDCGDFRLPIKGIADYSEFRMELEKSDFYSYASQLSSDYDKWERISRESVS